ncbi:MAG TPA: primosomal protein N' [Longimicrobiales bacterium]|nr:primosomal protein N' [Longimicrobiales bacterium]
MTLADASRVDVALPLPIHRTFTYRVDGPPPAPGTRVLVPFQRGERIGWVVGPGAAGAIRGLKTVLSVLEAEPSVPEDVLELCRWMGDYYVAPLGVAIRSALPSVLSDVSRDYVSLLGDPGPDVRPRERRLLEALGGREGPQRVRTLRDALGMGSIWPEIRSLGARGALAHRTVPPAEPTVKTRRVVRIARHVEDLVERERLFGRAGRQREAYELLEASGGAAELAHLLDGEGFSRSVVSGLEGKGLVELADEEELRDPFAHMTPTPAERLEPTGHQRAALEQLVAALDGPSPPFLLQGITGSGKTLVYIELLRAALARGRSAIVLVPEISLTPQTASRFRAQFGDQVAVLHSGLSDGERYDAWRSLRSGDRRIAVGARSALFAPLADLGVVVVDEEHDGSYKQSEAPRYQARDLAIVRAQAHQAVCVLGSATPSLESWSNARTGKFVRLSLPERAGGARLPEVRVVDLRVGRRPAGAGGSSDAGGTPKAAREEKRSGYSSILGEELVEAIRARLRRSEQVILLHNRRGYSSFVQCRECGDVEQCTNCSISLTYHRMKHKLLCHHCRYEEPAPTRCGRCGSEELSFRGLGTEQVERVTAETFPDARIARMDVDTTSGKWAHQRILDRVERGEVDILLGTQMIAKGLDFPRVTLVGVVNADVGIHLPDFRASERTFQLLSQVAGRAGRGRLGGEVVIQTSLPDHYAVRAAVAHAYEMFAERELDERQSPPYPPWVRIANVILSSPSQRLAASAAERAAEWLARWRDAGGGAGRTEPEIVGPAPSPIEKLHGRWRWHFLLRSRSARAIGEAGRALAEGFRPPAGDVRLALDRDPVALL